MQFGIKFIEGYAYALDAHQGQTRKGTQIPYIAHPLAVASLVLEFGGDEDLAIAGLLHDVIEDCDPVYAEQMQTNFGARVTSIVRQLTDGVPDETGEKPDWRTRKEAHIAHLRTASPDVLIVAACDKIHNARCLLADIQRDGLAAFEKFKGGVDGTIWYLTEVARATSSTAAGSTLFNLVLEISLATDRASAAALRMEEEHNERHAGYPPEGAALNAGGDDHE